MRTIALYLPQFHPIPENDEWWGPGFTEWRNVVKARPQFRGHYQPHLPADLGFYDLRVPETREAQAAMAARYGISGFCYYHYWFDGRRLLQRPFDEVLRSGTPDFPFCLCWANENWTRRWDGRQEQVLIAQKHSAEDDRAHIEFLLRAFADPRYIRIDGRPLFLVYRPMLLVEPKRTAAVWREVARHSGFPDLYLVKVEAFGDRTDPASIGFDAAMEFAPHFREVERIGQWAGRVRTRLMRAGLLPATPYLTHNVCRYEALVEHMLARAEAPYRRFRCATPSWDNAPRRAAGAWIFHGSTPDLYESWLRELVNETRVRHAGDEQLLFINAWNEWAEGNHLEPDQRWGHAYLEATARALTQARPAGGCRKQ
jgi:lipopolysaccharide biosynthesis protein